MADWADLMGKLLQLPVIAERTAEAFVSTDVAGYNYLGGRYELDGGLFPNRIILGSETYPSSIDRDWALVEGHDYVIGDFTWTGWDYLGEAGIGRVEYATDGAAPPARWRSGAFPG